jgi:hypothetical protein
VFLFATDAILAEYELVIPETLAEELPDINPHPKLVWVRARFQMVERRRWAGGGVAMRKTTFIWPLPWLRPQNILSPATKTCWTWENRLVSKPSVRRNFFAG